MYRKVHLYSETHKVQIRVAPLAAVRLMKLIDSLKTKPDALFSPHVQGSQQFLPFVYPLASF